MVYQTTQIMGVAWRGNVTPVHHIPDLRVNWSLPAHLEWYPVSGETLSERCKRLEQLAAHAIKYERNRAAALDELRRLYSQIGSLNQAVAERDGQFALLQSEGDKLRAERAELEKQLAAIRCSTS